MSQAAHGRPDTCPDGAVDPFGDGTPAPDDARCSYQAPGGSLVELRGQVTTASDGAHPGEPVDGVEVVVFVVVEGGRGVRREVARTRADAQGSFSIAAMLRPGRYTVGLADSPASARSFEIGASGSVPESLMVIVPRSMIAPR
ncbi:MAG: hypothetical protein JKY37_33425 [Nannocystaceae bacterium]|nr:hypothetical protein [Nannocystaceae bacterium]